MFTDTFEPKRPASWWRRPPIGRQVALSLVVPAVVLAASAAVGAPAHAATPYPTAVNDAFTVEPVGPTRMLVLANDIDPVSGTGGTGLVITSVSQPNLGSVTIAPGGRSLLYAAPGNGVTQTTTTVLTYTVRNGSGPGLTPGVVTLTLFHSAYATTDARTAAGIVNARVSTDGVESPPGRSYMGFSSLDFGFAAPRTVVVSGWNSSLWEGDIACTEAISVHLDSPTGPVIATGMYGSPMAVSWPASTATYLHSVIFELSSSCVTSGFIVAGLTRWFQFAR